MKSTQEIVTTGKVKLAPIIDYNGTRRQKEKTKDSYFSKVKPGETAIVVLTPEEFYRERYTIQGKTLTPKDFEERFEKRLGLKIDEMGQYRIHLDAYPREFNLADPLDALELAALKLRGLVVDDMSQVTDKTLFVLNDVVKEAHNKLKNSEIEYTFNQIVYEKLSSYDLKLLASYCYLPEPKNLSTEELKERLVSIPFEKKKEVLTKRSESKDRFNVACYIAALKQTGVINHNFQFNGVMLGTTNDNAISYLLSSTPDSQALLSAIQKEVEKLYVN